MELNARPRFKFSAGAGDTASGFPVSSKLFRLPFLAGLHMFGLMNDWYLLETNIRKYPPISIYLQGGYLPAPSLSGSIVT